MNLILIACTILLGVGLLASGVFANKLLTQKSAELSKLKAKSQVISDLQIALKKDKADIVKYKELNDIARAVVPQDKNQAQTIGEIVKMANDSGINKLTSITFPASTLGSGGAVKAEPGTLTQVTPVKGISGVYILPITISQDASHTVEYKQFIAFLRKLENNRRTAQVASISIQPDVKDPNLISFNLVVNEYIKP